MRQVINFGGGKDHYVEEEEHKTVCGLELEDREFSAVAETTLDNLCKRCYNTAVATVTFESTVTEVTEEVPEEVKPATGVKV